MRKAGSLKTRIRSGLVILFALLLILTATAVYTVGHFRRVAFDVSRRAEELPVADRLRSSVADMRMMISEVKGSRLAEQRVKSRLENRTSREIIRRLELFDFSRTHDFKSYSIFLKKMENCEQTLTDFEAFLRPRSDGKDAVALSTDGAVRDEETSVVEIRDRLAQLRPLAEDIRWPTDETMIEEIDARLTEIQSVAGQLPDGLYRELSGFSNSVRSQYRAIRFLAVLAGIASSALLVLLLRFSYVWIFRPLRVLVAGSRKVAGGDFGFRIRLDANDEFGELALALNQMTERFEGIRDDLDQQVRKRSAEVIRNERLASVGFLAAGVAHEINNPLASIAMSAESLPRRIRGLVSPERNDSQRAEELAIVEKYVAMIENEAFRCKQITEKLLDFSRTGGGEKSRVDLSELVDGMIEMAQTQKRYRRKKIDVVSDRPVIASVNPQEMKQVVLNLLTNALDSIPEDGIVRIGVKKKGDSVLLTVEDNGCGMEPKTLANIFEPFFTKKEPGCGTGLGLAIVRRIVTAHHGNVVATSGGVGQGARFCVELPA